MSRVRTLQLVLAALGIFASPVAVQAQGLNVGVDAGGVSAEVGTGGVSVGVGGDGGVSSGVGGVSAGVGGGSEALGLPTTAIPGQTSGGAANEQEKALQAVRSSRALPLADVLAAARRHTTGEIIDARLIEVRGFLLYELKVIEPGGDVADLYFYARSGEIVRTD